MSKRHHPALAFITTCLLSTALQAQTSYKCGNSYSQIPCPDGVLINTQDSRTEAQKRQSDLATRRDMRTANALEKTRLQQERKDLVANMPILSPLQTEGEGAIPSFTEGAKPRKEKDPGYFAARAPDESKQKKLKKSVKKKDASAP